MITQNFNDSSKWPAIFGSSNGMPVSNVDDMEEMKRVGGVFDGMSAMKGDKWEFPAMENMVVKKQPTRAGSVNMRYLILGERTRNNKVELAWFNLNSLLRQDVNRTNLFPEWCDLGNHHARMAKLAGRTIDITDEKDYRAPKFDNGRPVEGDSIPAKCAVVPFN
jgi:hypothetical protein